MFRTLASGLEPVLTKLGYCDQGGSNMTGTNCDLFTHKSFRSYLNHLIIKSRVEFENLNTYDWNSKFKMDCTKFWTNIHRTFWFMWRDICPLPCKRTITRRVLTSVASCASHVAHMVYDDGVKWLQRNVFCDKENCSITRRFSNKAITGHDS
jgi:hypothetical protein